MTTDNQAVMADFARRRYRQELKRIESDQKHRRQEQADIEEAIRLLGMRKQDILRKLAALDTGSDK